MWQPTGRGPGQAPSGGRGLLSGGLLVRHDALQALIASAAESKRGGKPRGDRDVRARGQPSPSSRLAWDSAAMPGDNESPQSAAVFFDLATHKRALV